MHNLLRDNDEETVVRLSVEERQVLHGLVHHGREAAYRRKHAQVLLLAVCSCFSGTSGGTQWVLTANIKANP